MQRKLFGGVDWYRPSGFFGFAQNDSVLVFARNGDGRERFARSANNPPFAMKLQRMGHPAHGAQSGGVIGI
ncbi:MAG TPA: hypothetical protein VGB94_10485 [Acidobacteriaceae bacterium]